ncbi:MULTISPECIES: TetR/AcrR family transcriptional regulator [unclassified Crossiella]|uniref:TetR/AcrR family transcriptional regulator n=1 Tax=unclassified Crossiella TaxID=2620835 RepID=UPI0020000D28|nr:MULTISPECIES: TetR/AcrR family transcriptional regulator [unclassified Crossiella]MCK2243368.1 TetR/AcrR family transcriptional regulator [Crossiella sp. S99.2]MCK2254163.1 TetR/AcrR family transcriptional regulator [Crossiella sp. S99.1]
MANIEYSGHGDPARSLALLWRTSERASRKGKPELNVDRIVRTAIEVADTEGLSALSMRRVAEELGVGTMSLYTYVPGKGELIDVMLDTVFGELPHTHPDGGWRDRLEHVARQNQALYQRHAWLPHVLMSRPVLGPNVTAKYDHELSAIDGIGLSDVEMDSVLWLVLDYVHSAVRNAAEIEVANQRSGVTDEQWWQAHAPLLSKVLDPARYPVASRVGQAAGMQHGGAVDPAHAFEFGLARVLDGVEVLVRQRAAG